MNENNKENVIFTMTNQCQQARAIKQSPGGLEKWIGHIVKMGFPEDETQGGPTEWMWLEITGVEGDQLVGTLVSQPFLATYLEYGDRVTLKEREIYAVHS